MNKESYLNERLENLNEAITAIELGAQSYQIGSRRIQKADLNTLYAERNRIETIINNGDNNDNCYAVAFGGR